MEITYNPSPHSFSISNPGALVKNIKNKVQSRFQIQNGTEQVHSFIRELKQASFQVQLINKNLCDDLRGINLYDHAVYFQQIQTAQSSFFSFLQSKLKSIIEKYDFMKRNQIQKTFTRQHCSICQKQVNQIRIQEVYNSLPARSPLQQYKQIPFEVQQQSEEEITEVEYLMRQLEKTKKNFNQLNNQKTIRSLQQFLNDNTSSVDHLFRDKLNYQRMVDGRGQVANLFKQFIRKFMQVSDSDIKPSVLKYAQQLAQFLFKRKKDMTIRQDYQTQTNISYAQMVSNYNPQQRAKSFKATKQISKQFMQKNQQTLFEHKVRIQVLTKENQILQQQVKVTQKELIQLKTNMLAQAQAKSIRKSLEQASINSNNQQNADKQKQLLKQQLSNIQQIHVDNPKGLSFIKSSKRRNSEQFSLQKDMTKSTQKHEYKKLRSSEQNKTNNNENIELDMISQKELNLESKLSSKQFIQSFKGRSSSQSRKISLNQNKQSRKSNIQSQLSDSEYNQLRKQIKNQMIQTQKFTSNVQIQTQQIYLYQRTNEKENKQRSSQSSNIIKDRIVKRHKESISSQLDWQRKRQSKYGAVGETKRYGGIGSRNDSSLYRIVEKSPLPPPNVTQNQLIELISSFNSKKLNELFAKYMQQQSRKRKKTENEQNHYMQVPIISNDRHSIKRIKQFRSSIPFQSNKDSMIQPGYERKLTDQSVSLQILKPNNAFDLTNVQYQQGQISQPRSKALSLVKDNKIQRTLSTRFKSTHNSKAQYLKSQILRTNSVYQLNNQQNTKLIKQYQHHFQKQDLIALFGNLQSAYDYESNPNPRYRILSKNKKKYDSIILQSYQQIQKLKSSNAPLYHKIKSFIKFPYQSVINQFQGPVIQSNMSFNVFSNILTHILNKHQSCSKIDNNIYCKHIKALLNKFKGQLDTRKMSLPKLHDQNQ